VEAKAWQAFYATLLLERSKFGLNELLGLIPAPRHDLTHTADHAWPLTKVAARLGSENAL